MITFPLFAELERHRDEANSNFHHNIKPLLLERLKDFGFVQTNEDVPGLMELQEKATQNKYLLTLHRYEIIIQFQHVKTGEHVLICAISNLELSAHVIMDTIINSIDSWLQYGVVYDYKKAQGLEERARKRG